MNFEGRNILSVSDFSKEELLKIVEATRKIDGSLTSNSQALQGKIVATLFFEASTRTRMSFQAAMQRMGGSVIGFSDVSTSSMKKGESVADTIKVVSGYCDVIVMRHPEEGSVAEAAKHAGVPVINAGDGSNEHPSQTMLDLYTIAQERGSLENLKIGFIGDLKYGRTVHSLANALTHFNPEFYFVAPEQLRMPSKYLEVFKEKNIKYFEEEDLMKVSKDLDVIYATRVQKERFESEGDYDKVKKGHILDESLIDHIRDDALILHPLPRADEMNPELDRFKQSVYFKQAHNGIPLRMALLALVLGKIK